MSDVEDDPVNWMPASEAIKAFSARFGPERGRKELIALAIEGAVRARSGRKLSQKFNEYDHDTNVVHERILTDNYTPLEPDFFEALELNGGEEDWEGNRLTARIQAEQRGTWMSGPWLDYWIVRASAVEFSRSDVLATAPVAPLPHVTGVAGRPTSISGALIIYDERVAKGLTMQMLSDEAKQIILAFDQDPRFVGWPKLTPKTIANNLREKHLAQNKKH